MAMGWGSVLAQGILGGVMGAGKGAYENAVEEQKKLAEIEKEKRLSELRVTEYKKKNDIDIEAIPRKGEAETGVAVKKEEAMRPGIVETARQKTNVETGALNERERNRIETNLEFAPEIAKAKAQETKLVEAEKMPFRLAEIKAHGDQSMRIAEVQADEAAKRDWTAGADGRYYDAHGRLITTRVKIEGRGFEEVPVTVPKEKLEGRNATWELRENLDSLNRRIEYAERNGDEETLKKLLVEKDRLLRGTKASNTSSNTSNRPPLSSFQR